VAWDPAAGEAVVSRSRLWINLVLVYWPLVTSPQRELQGVLGSPSGKLRG